MDGVPRDLYDITRNTAVREDQEELGHRVWAVMQTVLEAPATAWRNNPAPAPLINRLTAVAPLTPWCRAAIGADLSRCNDLAAKELGNYGIGRDARIVHRRPGGPDEGEGAVGHRHGAAELAANAAKTCARFRCRRAGCGLAADRGGRWTARALAHPLGWPGVGGPPHREDRKRRIGRPS